MATFLSRLGRAVYRRWYVAIAAWLVVLVALGGVAVGFGKPMVDQFSIPGIPSEEAADLQQDLFPGAEDAFDASTVTVVVAAPEGQRLAEPRWSAAVDDLIADLEDLPQVADDLEIADPVTAAARQEQQIVQGAVQAGGDRAAAQRDAASVSPLAEGGRVGLISYDYDVDSVGQVEPSTRDAVLDALDDARDDGLVAEANGPGMQDFAPPGAESELLGIAVALGVLVLTFGTLVAAGLPILTALVGVGLGVSGVTAMTLVTDIGSTTPVLATMIGLAVGIDYTLFILARYRSELARVASREEAVGRAVGTAGTAVVFAGLTVVVALTALAVVRIPFLTAMGLAAAATVMIAVLVALTLLPAVLGLLRSRAFGGTVRRYRPRQDEQGRVLNNGVRWAQLVRRAPVAAVLAVVVGLGALALPLGGLQLAFPTDSTASSDTTQRQASDLVEEAFGPGREAPLLVVVDAADVPAPQRQQAFGAVTAWAEEQDGVVNAQVTTTNADPGAEQGTPAATPTGAQVLVTPQFGPEDSRAEELLTGLRDTQDEIEEQTGATVGVTGITAIQSDVSDRLADALPVYLAVIVGLAFVLLMLVFRSLLVPLTATFGFLLSVLATLGATVAVFQEGALGLVEGQPLVSFMPIFVIGVVFGLAMDYQVFLVTRIREARTQGLDPAEAVVDGFRNSARVVAAAAVIMISVFAAFMLQDDAIISSMGFALAVAVALDAFVIRMLLVPALMYLMGDHAWWLPRWLDRLLPSVDVEGEALGPPDADAEPVEIPEPLPGRHRRDRVGVGS